MGLAAIDCIQRGMSSLRANWELVLVQILQSVVVTVIAIAGLLPPLAVIGFGIFDAVRGFSPGNPLAWQRLLSSWLETLTVNLPALLAACVATLVVWLLAFLVYCYFQGGIYGVLAAADRQAPPGAVRGVDWFRTFSLRDVRGWGARYVWRFFAFWNLVLLVASAWLLATVGWIALVVWGQMKWGMGAAFGIGCGGALPIVFGWVAFGLWAALSAAALPDATANMLSAARHGLVVLGRRLGGVLLIVLVFVAALMAATLVFTPLTLAFDFVLREDLVANLAVSVVLGLAQAMLSSVVGIALTAAWIALVRSERTTAGNAA